MNLENNERKKYYTSKHPLHPHYTGNIQMKLQLMKLQKQYKHLKVKSNSESKKSSKTAYQSLRKKMCFSQLRLQRHVFFLRIFLNCHQNKCEFS